MFNDVLYGTDLFGASTKPKAAGVVAERFVIPPFTILDAKQGEWQERKRAWAALGISGEVGRDVGLTYTGEVMKSLDFYRVKEGLRESSDVQGTSIFDPVVCELAYRWFSPVGGQVVDPFAGGSVRGIVAGALGRKYWGCDLRAEQIAANRAQAEDIETAERPEWVCGDSMETLTDAPAADFVFSCPPYGDLEKYSDDPADLSSMEWHTFAAAYSRIIMRAVAKLKPDSFACFVVGDFRDNKGFYRNFVSKTIEAFEECGARLYNEAILATSVGSAAMRVTKQFDASRKMAKTHQNVLVFIKGDPRKAADKCGARA
jgi:DNA modification methylase